LAASVIASVIASVWSSDESDVAKDSVRTCVRDSGRFSVAETIAREHEKLPLDFALALVRLYAEKRDPRFERAALRYLERYITETNPSLMDVAQMAGLLAERLPR
jgi:hypothetical protein